MTRREAQLASLLVEELRIDSAALHEFPMSTDLDHLTTIEHYDHIRIDGACEPMRYQE